MTYLKAKENEYPELQEETSLKASIKPQLHPLQRFWLLQQTQWKWGEMVN